MDDFDNVREPDAFMAIMDPTGPDAMALNALMKARRSSATAVQGPPKDLSSLQAQAALIGWALDIRVDGPVAVLTLQRSLGDIEEARSVLRYLGAMTP